MNLPAVLYAIRWLIYDTFRQALASGIFWVMLALSAICILLCLSVGVSDTTPLPKDGDKEFLPRVTKENPKNVEKSQLPRVGGELTLAFGAFPIPLGRDVADTVRFMQTMLAAAAADTLGILLALVWTAGFLPTFLEPSAASVLLAKPAPRWSILIGKYLGVLAFVGIQGIFFVGGTFLALGLRTGVWNSLYLLAIPVMLLNFAVFFSFSVLLAVVTRSTVVCVFGSIVFWLVCWGINFGRHTAVGLPDVQALSEGFRFLLEAGYWILPKPADMSLLLYDALDTRNFLSRAVQLKNVQEQGHFHPDLSILTSLLFTASMVALAAYEFAFQDY